jgi:hypothetical protein
VRILEAVRRWGGGGDYVGEEFRLDCGGVDGMFVERRCYLGCGLHPRLGGCRNDVNGREAFGADELPDVEVVDVNN